MNELQQNVPAGGIVIAMCATKCDLENDPDTSQAEALAAQTGAMFMTTSSKTNSNVHLLFQKVTERVLDYQRRNCNAGLSGSDIPVTLATTAVETGQEQHNNNNNNNNNHNNNTSSPPSSPARSMNNNNNNNRANNNNNNNNAAAATTTSIGNSNNQQQFSSTTTAQQENGSSNAVFTGSQFKFVDEKKMELEENRTLWHMSTQMRIYLKSHKRLT